MTHTFAPVRLRSGSACWDSSCWRCWPDAAVLPLPPQSKSRSNPPPPPTDPRDEKERPRRQGQWIRIPLPIDNSVVLRVKQSIERTLGAAHDERPVFVLEFVVPEGAADAGQGTQFEDAHKLARFLTSDELNGASTVAYVPKALKGHAVLVAMACEQIIMSSAATMGDAGADEKVIGNTMLAPQCRHLRAEADGGQAFGTFRAAIGQQANDQPADRAEQKAQCKAEAESASRFADERADASKSGNDAGIHR